MVVCAYIVLIIMVHVEIFDPSSCYQIGIYDQLAVDILIAAFF